MSVSLAEVSSSIALHCTALHNEDRKKRKKALELLSIEILRKVSGPSVEDKAYQSFKDILRCFNDKVEAIRECAVNIIIDILNVITDKNDDYYLPIIMPVITQRIGSLEIVESSEEVRLLLVSLLRVVIQKFQTKIAPYLDDFVKILVQTLVDPFPNVKKESCECAAELAKAIPRHFHMQSESLIKPVLQSITHQHYKVRVSAINCIGDIIRYGNNKSIVDVCGPLAERLFDQIPMVRQAVNRVVGTWLLHLPDRYSFFHRLLPILLSGLVDELPEVRQEACCLWESAGEQYMTENEEELKDQMDFLRAPPEHYPEGVIRPNLGCRTLTRRHLSKIVPILVKELTDWLPAIRVKSAQLLCVLLLNAEVQMTHHLECILPSMYRAACDEETGVVENIEQAAIYIGYFVPCETYWPLLLPTMEENTNAGNLRIFAAIVRGTQHDALRLKLEEMAEFISRDAVCRSKDFTYQQQVLKCCEALMSACQEECRSVSQQLFTALVTVLGQAATQHIVERAKDLLTTLSELTGCKIFEQHMPSLLGHITKTVESWSLHSAERHIFEALIMYSGSEVGHCMSYIVSTFATILNPEKEAELRLKCLMTLSFLLSNHDSTFQELDNPSPHLMAIIKEVISPNLMWHSGRTAEAIRTAAVCCLVSALHSDPFTDKPTLDEVFGTLNPLLLSLVEDPSKKTRLHTLTALRLLTGLMHARDMLTRDLLHGMYPVVLKRLDDVSDECRLAAVKTLKVFFSRAPTDYNPASSQAHLSALFNSMIIHLDDSDPVIQAAVLDALMTIGKISPQLLLEKVNGSKQNFRNKKDLNSLTEFLESMVD